MIRALKALFLGRLLREKLLLVVFIALGAFIWLYSFGGRAARFWRTQQANRSTLATQTLVLGRRAAIEARAQQSISRLDPARTLNDTRLLGEVNAIANGVGLRNNLSSDDPRNERTSQFAVNSLRFTVRKADLGSLVKFYQELQKHSPYIGLEEFSLQADPANPALLNASLRVSSVEIIR
jgi:hypothetical protein